MKKEKREKIKVTIHRGLSELKLLNAKITKKIQSIDSVNFYQKGKLVGGVIELEKFKSDAKSKFESASDLIFLKGKIKSAIVEANAKTKLKIAGVTMTIADAINAKEAIEYKRALLTLLKDQRTRALGVFNKNNEKVRADLQTLLEKMFGKEGVKAGSADFEAVSRPFLDANEFHLADPLGVEVIENLEKEIDDFEADVDAALSEINATTFIEY